MKTILKKGLERTIFTDPLSEKIPEDEAVLLKKISEDNFDGNTTSIEDWWVRFVSDGTVCRRKIRIN